jgi:hypothetical protein
LLLIFISCKLVDSWGFCHLGFSLPQDTLSLDVLSVFEYIYKVFIEKRCANLRYNNQGNLNPNSAKAIFILLQINFTTDMKDRGIKKHLFSTSLPLLPIDVVI